MKHSVGRLIIACSLVVAVGCDEGEKSGKSGTGNGPFGQSASAKPTTTDDKKPKPAVAENTTPTAPVAAPTGVPKPGIDPGAAAAAELAKQAANMGAAAGKPGTLGGLSDIPGMNGTTLGGAPAAAPAAKVTTMMGGLSRLAAIQTAACACKGRPCAQRALNAFGVLYNDIKNLAANPTVYAKVKKRSADITRCLVKNGITGQEVMATFTGKPAAASGSTLGGSGSNLTRHIEKLATQACMCKDKSCAMRSLGQLASFYAKNKNVQADQASLTRIKNASAKMARCLVQNGIDPKTLTTMFPQ